ncbi:MAG: diguanylate cyclase domain-containing protein, partial [Betaproteobacteria bacterium]
GQAGALAAGRASPLAVLLVCLVGPRRGAAARPAVARGLASSVRKADTLARQGADEFVVLMGEVRAPTDPAETATRLLRVLQGFSASIGISLFPADARDADALLRNAEAAMLRARQLGSNRFAFYAR